MVQSLRQRKNRGGRGLARQDDHAFRRRHGHAFHDLINLQQKISSTKGETIEASAVTIRSVVVAFIILSAILAGVIAYYAVLSLVRPLGNWSASLIRSPSGDLAVPAASGSREDEMGVLAKAFDRMVIS